MSVGDREPAVFADLARTLSRSVQLYPDRCALVWGERNWTYGELCHSVTAACRVLARLSGPGARRIAIVGQNHPSYVLAYYATQFLGAASVEIGASESIKTMLALIRRTEVAAVLSDREDLLGELSGEFPVMSFEEFLSACDETLAESECAEAPAPRESDAEASIVFTSGTTSLPKGVILSQRNVCFVVERVVDYLGLRPEDRYGLILPLSHTYGKSVLLTTFAAGATCLMLDNFVDLERFLERLVAERCTVLSLVPYHAGLLLRRTNLADRKLCALRILTFSGNALPESSVRGLRDALPWVEIYAMYGMTECATRISYLPPDRLDEKPGSVGAPLPGMELRILREDGSEAAPGETGELFLRGENVMAGYFDEPELTAQTITDSWLRTGDLGVLDADGHLAIVGRHKDIIKCAGERLSPAEIEAALCAHPDIQEAAVTAKPDHVLGEAVWAFVVLVPGAEDLGPIKAHCARTLSHHKIPRHYTRVEALPKTSSGKVRKHLLPGMADNG